MSDIVVTTIDNSFIHIDTSPAIMRELSDHFSFMATNYKFIPKYKNGLWDGKIRLYKLMGSTLPYGLFNELQQYATECDYSLLDSRASLPIQKYSTSNVDAFTALLDIHSGDKSIKLYEHQEEAVKEVIKNSRSTILSPTSSGKSLILYVLSLWYQSTQRNKILIIVPTVNLVSQLYSDFMDYSSCIDWKVDSNCHKIFAGQDKNSKKQIYISTYQSLRTQPKSYFSQFGVVFCDEVHTAEAKSITGIMEKCANACVRAGFTGTLKKMKSNQMVINGLFGSVKRVSTTSDLIKKGLITPFDVKFMILKYNPAVSKEINKQVLEGKTPYGKKIYRNNYQNEIDYITQCTKRNEYIANLAAALDGNVLILFTKVEKHGKPLHKLIKNKQKVLDNPKEVYYISGETKGEKREEIRNTIEDTDNAILVASFGTLSTGVNIKSLKYVIFASPYKSEIKVLQSVGRILRLKEGKEKAVLFDLVDDFRYKKRINYSYKHFLERWDIFRDEKFPMSIIEYSM